MKRAIIAFVVLTLTGGLLNAAEKAIPGQDLFTKTFFSKNDPKPAMFELKVFNEKENVAGIGKANPWLFKEEDIAKLFKLMKKSNGEPLEYKGEDIKKMYFCILQSQVGVAITVAYFSYLFDTPENLQKHLPALEETSDLDRSAFLIKDNVLVILWTDDEWTNDGIGQQAMESYRVQLSKRLGIAPKKVAEMDLSTPEKSWAQFQKYLRYRDYESAYLIFSDKIRNTPGFTQEAFKNAFLIHTRSIITSKLIRGKTGENQARLAIEMEMPTGRYNVNVPPSGGDKGHQIGEIIYKKDIAVFEFVKTAPNVWQMERTLKRGTPGAQLKNTYDNILAVGNALQSYYETNKKYPTAKDLWKCLKNDLKAKGRNEKVLNDGWDNPLVYAPPAQDDQPFTLYSSGPNKKDEAGKEDDILFDDVQFAQVEKE